MLKEPIGAIEPLLWFKVMVTRLFALRWMPQMMMVPSENQRRQDLLRNLSKELGIQHFGLVVRDDDIIKVRWKGLKDCVKGCIIKLFEQLKKQCELRLHACCCTELPL